MATKLKRLIVDRVDLVDKGACRDRATNEGAHVRLFKRDSEDAECERCKRSGKECKCGDLAKLDAALDSADGLRGAVEKVGRKVSAARYKRLRAMKEYLDSVLAEADEERDMSTDTKKADGLTPDEIQKRIDDGIAEAIKKVHTDAAAKVAEAQEQVRKAQETADKAVADAARAAAEAAIEKRARLTREYADKRQPVLKSLPGVDLSTDAALLIELEEKLPDVAKRVNEILDAAAKVIAESRLFTEVGKRGAGDPAAGDTAYAQVVAKAEKLVADKTCPSVAEAIEKVATDDPALYNRYLAEHRAAAKK